MNKLVLVEHVNPDQIFDILKSPLLDKGHADRLASYYRIARKHNGRVPVTYVKRSSGRYYPEDGYPLHAIYQWRSVRASLYGEREYDIDAVSCHPAIMKYLAKKFGLDCGILELYVKNRQTFIDDLDINQDDVETYNAKEFSNWTAKDMCKMVFTSSMFGAGIKKIISVLHMQRSPVKGGSISEQLLTEIHGISKVLGKLQCYSHLKENIEDVHNGKVVSRIISNIESDIVTKLIRTFQANDLEVTVYMYDGFQVKTQDEEFVDELLEEFNEENEYGLTFIRKDFAETVQTVQKHWTGPYARTQEEVDTLIKHIQNPEVACVAKMLETEVPEEIKSITYSQQYCKPFEEDCLCNIIKSDLGSGKSYQVREFFNKHNPESALFLTPRRIFARSIKANFGDKWALYLDNGSKKVLSDPYLICQINSLHKVVKMYDHVYVDEIESCLEMLSATILTKKRRDVVETIENIFRHAKKIIMCDADISMRTFDFIKGMGISPSKIFYEHNTMVNRSREAIRVPNDNTLLWHLRDLLQQGKNVVVFSASKRFLVDRVLPTITSPDLGLTEDDYLIYTADSSNSIAEVEKEWKGKRVIAYTPTITVGVDFNLPDCFDTVLVYAQNFGCGPVRQIFQAIHRVRKIRENYIYYVLNTQPEPAHRYPFDNYSDAVEYVDNCVELKEFDQDGAKAPEWFREIHIWNMLEAGLSKNKYEYVFDYFLARYGYQKKTTELKDLSKEEREEAVAEEFIDFDQVEDIEYEEFLRFDSLLHNGELDPLQRRQYYKWRFRCDFDAISTQFFPLMLSSKGRHVLKRLNWEIRNSKTSDILKHQLDSDYLETVNYDSIILGKVQDINRYLGICHSADPKEIPLGRFSKPEVLSSLSDVSKILKLSTGKKDVTNVEHLYRFWNGCSIQPVRSEGGKGIKKVRVNGKQERVYQIVGFEGFLK